MIHWATLLGYVLIIGGVIWYRGVDISFTNWQFYIAWVVIWTGVNLWHEGKKK